MRNVHGWSEYSPEEMIVANTVPTKPLNVRTTNTLDKVVVTWDQSASTGGTGVPLTEYKFYGRKKGGSNANTADFIEIDSSLCVEDMATVISSKQCSFPMTVFTGLDFALIQGDYIVVKIKTENQLASNTFGWSDLSDPNDELTAAAKVEVLPHKPSNVPTRDPTSSDT